MLAELNRVRARHRLSPVAADARMARTAAAHSREMLRRGWLAHGSWASRVARAAGSPRKLGEVLGRMRSSSPRREARTLVRNWLRSAGHRQILLDAAFRRVGIGRAAGRSSALYTVDWASAR